VNRSFNAWKEGAKLYGPLLAVGVLTALFLWMWLAVLFLVVGGCVALFFRDPRRAVPGEDNVAVSAADGIVTDVAELDESPYYEGRCRRISVFLSLLNVHINRAPLAGTIRDIVYRPGLFINAMKPESGEVNESNTIYLDTQWGPVTVRQIAGIVARRIVCSKTKGDGLARGEKFGMIRFGSRTEVYLPLSAKVAVRPKDSVRAGSTVIARLE